MQDKTNYIKPQKKAKTKKKLFSEFYKMNLLASISIFVIVELLSITLYLHLQTKDLNMQAISTVNEAAILLAEPLYNLDSLQIERIAEGVLSSKRVSGILIKSDLGHVFFNKRDTSKNEKLHSQERIVYNKGINVGSFYLDFNYESVRSVRNLTIHTSLVIIALMIAVSVILNKKLLIPHISKPFSIIIQGISSLETTNYKLNLPLSPYSDIDILINHLNSMANSVKEKNEELARLNLSLEERVEERTAELKASLEKLAQAQEKIVESSRLAALGHLSAGIAHELNSPLAAILSSVEAIKTYLKDIVACRTNNFSELDKNHEALYKKLIDISLPLITDFELVFASSKKEKALATELEGMGIKNAGILAHFIAGLGIANKLEEFINYFAGIDPIETLKAAYKDIEAHKAAEIISFSAQKATNVVGALRSFLNKDSNTYTEKVSLKEEIEKVLILFNNALKHRVKVVMDMDNVIIEGNKERLSQVFMNLIRNAAQAMDYNGILELSLKKQGDKAVVRIIDSGTGIPVEIAEHIFEPFFTTKSSGEGMGLGLDLVKRIVETHGGSINLESSPGRTVFTVILPLSQS